MNTIEVLTLLLVIFLSRLYYGRLEKSGLLLLQIINPENTIREGYALFSNKSIFVGQLHILVLE